MRREIEEGERKLRQDHAAPARSAEKSVARYFDILVENKLWPATRAFEETPLSRIVEKMKCLPCEDSDMHDYLLGRHLSDLKEAAWKVEGEMVVEFPQTSSLEYFFHEKPWRPS